MMRVDLEMVIPWIEPGSRVLDLGCGDGTLLHYLMQERRVKGYGLEIDQNNVIAAIDKGVNVIQGDLDQGLAKYFDDDSFDYVVMTQTLQAVQRPDLLLKEMLRIGREGIVTFPNMGYWKNRLQLLACPPAHPGQPVASQPVRRDRGLSTHPRLNRPAFPAGLNFFS